MRVPAAFQCVHDYCKLEDGKYIMQGNTDTGPVEELNLGLERTVIPPSLINTLNADQSDNQGRCGQCKSYEASTEP